MAGDLISHNKYFDVNDQDIITFNNCQTLWVYLTNNHNFFVRYLFTKKQFRN
jgi:hypothetical protein